MLLSVRMKRIEDKFATTKLEPCGEPAPLKNYYINTELLNSLPLGEELMLFLSDRPIAEGEVIVALPPVPFFKLLKNSVRYEHRTAKDRRAANTPELPVTLSYVKRTDLPDEFIAARKPLYSGICPVPEAVAEEEQATVDTTDLADEVAGADAVAAFDAFLRERVRVQRSGRITSRQIWGVWVARCSADPADDPIAGVAFSDVSRRFRVTFGATAAKGPTRIDGMSQRYWSGYTI